MNKKPEEFPLIDTTSYQEEHQGTFIAFYGLDAPYYVFAFYGIAMILDVIAFVCCVAAVTFYIFGLYNHIFILAMVALGCGSPGLSLTITTLMMIWSSLRGKLNGVEKLIALRNWRGDERILDVGCGHGLCLIHAAKRLTTGRAFGIDIWEASDQLDNQPLKVKHNASAEQVEELIEIASGDAREMPFPNANFDVIYSSFMLHNLANATERAKVIEEMIRVLREDGEIYIWDIAHIGEYSKTLRRLGCRVEKLSLNRLPLFCAPMTGALRATKDHING